MHDFEGMEEADGHTVKAMVDFSFFLMLGNMDDAFKVRSYSICILPDSNSPLYPTTNRPFNLCATRLFGSIWPRFASRPIDWMLQRIALVTWAVHTP